MAVQDKAAARKTPTPASGGRQRGRRAAPRRGGPVYGAIDLGTNNCRLLIAEPAESGFHVVDAFSRVVQLGEGCGTGRPLGEAGIERTLDALSVCAAKLRRRRADRVRAVATEACRRAANADAFVTRVRRQTGIDLEIIPPEEEARLAIAGCLPLIDRSHDRALIFDIGGGSTQIVWLGIQADGRPPDVLGAHSLPVGVVGLSEQLAQRTPFGLPIHTRETAGAAVRDGLRRFCAAHGIREAVADGRVQMLGASGTVTTLTGIDQGLRRYDRARVDGAWLGFGAIRDISERLVALDRAERQAHPCVGRDRADLVIAGCVILRAICATWPVGRLRVADRGLREGILMDLMAAAEREG